MADNDDYSRLVETAQSDEGVLGLVLTGSRGRGVFVSPASDWDVRLVVRDDDLAACVERFATPHGSPVEVAVFSLSSFEQAGAIGSPNEWDRYSYAHADVVLDELGGQIGALVTEKGLLPPVAAREIAERALDTYINSYYRSAKNLRNGLAVEAQLDAAESISPFLTALFAMHERVRPFNKFLCWELEEFPLGDATWSAQKPPATAPGDHYYRVPQRAAASISESGAPRARPGTWRCRGWMGA
jgi:hypothetical protein